MLETTKRTSNLKKHFHAAKDWLSIVNRFWQAHSSLKYPYIACSNYSKLIAAACFIEQLALEAPRSAHPSLMFLIESNHF
jgi:hypothetical protein